MSSASGIIKLLDLAVAASTLLEEYNQAVTDINARLKQARDEGRDITWEEIEASQKKLDAAIERGREKLSRDRQA